MTLRNLHALYLENDVKTFPKLVLCEWLTQEGFAINSMDDFTQIVDSIKTEMYLLNKQESKSTLIYDYFTMSKAKPHVVALAHPLLTNGYFKDLPDQTIDIHINGDGVYRYLFVDYGAGIKEYIIEFPSEIAGPIYERFKDILPNASSVDNISLIFTNSDRFTVLEPSNFLIYNLEDIYPDWAVKKITTLNLSKKVWNELKAIK
jgi:hypothetical protein